MPYDPDPAILTTLSLEALSYALRHPEVWPPGFEWDYSDCCMCAMGLAHKLWDEVIVPGPACIAIAFNIPLDISRRIFMRGNYVESVCSAITPDHVADWIDEYIRERA